MMPLPLFPFVFLCLPLLVSCVLSTQIAILLLMKFVRGVLGLHLVLCS